MVGAGAADFAPAASVGAKANLNKRGRSPSRRRDKTTILHPFTPSQRSLFGPDDIKDLNPPGRKSVVGRVVIKADDPQTTEMPHRIGHRHSATGQKMSDYSLTASAITSRHYHIVFLLRADREAAQAAFKNGRVGEEKQEVIAHNQSNANAFGKPADS
jgi:hypothetical protein